MAINHPLDMKLDSSADQIDDVEYQKEHVELAEESISVSYTRQTSKPMLTARQHEPVFDPKETKRILRKVDFRLLPVLTLLYLLTNLDSQLEARKMRSVFTP